MPLKSDQVVEKITSFVMRETSTMDDKTAMEIIDAVADWCNTILYTKSHPRPKR